MELNLKIDGIEIRRLWEKELFLKRKKIQSQDNFFVFLVILAFIPGIFTSLLISFHPNWFYFSVFFFFAGIVGIGLLMIFRWKSRKSLIDLEKTVDKIVAEIKGLNEVKLIYQEDSFEIYRNGEKAGEYSWEGINRAYKSSEHLFVGFEDAEKNLWISRKAALNEELKKFEEFIATKTTFNPGF